LAIAGLAETPPVDGYGRPEDDDEDEEGFARTNAAHDRLFRFETRVRRFIEERMLVACGAQWVKQRVPGSLRGGAPDLPLIAYADFSDLQDDQLYLLAETTRILRAIADSGI
jgi:hypothetical protein